MDGWMDKKMEKIDGWWMDRKNEKKIDGWSDVKSHERNVVLDDSPPPISNSEKNT